MKSVVKKPLQKTGDQDKSGTPKKVQSKRRNSAKKSSAKKSETKDSTSDEDLHMWE